MTSEFAIGDRVRLSPTSPNIRLANRVGDAVGIIRAEDDFKAWVVQWPKVAVSAVHEHEIERVTDMCSECETDWGGCSNCDTATEPWYTRKEPNENE